jgi:hypothetical protein
LLEQVKLISRFTSRFIRKRPHIVERGIAPANRFL